MTSQLRCDGAEALDEMPCDRPGDGLGGGPGALHGTRAGVAVPPAELAIVGGGMVGACLALALA